MKIQKYIKTGFILLGVLWGIQLYAQESLPEKKQPTKEEIMSMNYDQLLELPFNELINLANIMGVSADELLQMILNKDVSSASKMKEKVFDSPLSTTVISADELMKSGALSIPEALRLIPGMIIREKTPGNFDIHVRGNDNVPSKNIYLYTEDATSLVMIDNRPVYNYAFGGTFWESLPIDLGDVDRIEVIRGPSSALYGPNAVSGVINIITKNPEKNKLAVTSSIQAGTRNSLIANVGVSGGLGNKFKYRLSANHQHQERFDRNYYVFDINQDLSYSGLDTLHNYWSKNPLQKQALAEGDLQERIPNDRFAIDKYGYNAFLFYDVNDKVHFNLSAGYQESDIVSTCLAVHAIPYTGRKSYSKYTDFKASIHGFEFQANYLSANQQVEQGNPSYHIEPSILNSQLEYEYKLGPLTLRPGVSYQKAVYSDKDYVDASIKEGFLNGSKELNTIAGFLRADYRPIDKLRLIAALRADKYNYPDKNYFTYQFISSYTFNQNNIARLVYSRANRGPFIVDTYADYAWPVIDNYYSLLWSGNKNLKLPVMDMFEAGYRFKIGQHVLVDLEAFHTITKDYNYFLADSLTLNANWAGVMSGTAAQPSITSVYGTIRYYNMELQSVQNGITANISVAINKKLNFRLFGTLQESKLKKFYSKTFWQDVENLQNMASAQIYADGIALAQHDMTLIGSLMSNNYQKSYTAASVVNPDSLQDITNKSTPSFFGGLSVDYTPWDKLSVFASAYVYSAQSILISEVDKTNAYNAQNRYKVNPKVIPSLKISYKVWKENSLFFNARNFLDSNKKEFAYTDHIGGTYLLGVDIKF
jgi:iron complex outermembrane receptor protein